MGAPAAIHPTALVAAGARLGAGVRIGPYAIIGEHAIIGDGVEIGAHAVVEGWTEIGPRCRISPHAVLGTPPQDVKYRGEPTRLMVGEETIIREFATLHRGTPGGGGITSVGRRNFIMAYAHVAHDCHLEDQVIMANQATLAGHCLVEEHAIIGGMTGVHQQVRIGRYAFVSACSAVAQDVLPYIKAHGNRAKPHGLNTVGLRRHAFPDETIRRLKMVYRILFLSDLNTTQALERIEKEVEACPEVAHLTAFIRTSERGISK